MILAEAGFQPVEDDFKFIKRAEDVALSCGYRPVELCWMTWLVQGEA